MTGAHAQVPAEPQPQHGAHAPGWTLAGLVRAAAVAGIALGVGAGLGYLIAHQPAPGPASVEHEQPSSAGAAELALVAPLVPGSALADFEVAAIQAVSAEGTLRVLCERGEASVALDVGLVADGGPIPPAVAGRYAIFYAIRGATSQEGERLAAALAAILEQNAAAPIPPGMAPYRPVAQ